MISCLRCLFFVSFLLVSGHSSALIETYEFSDPMLEERYHHLTQELRCPKCQNQNIADSDAPISKDLRSTLHQQLEQGASDEEIREYMVARYGEFVRYRPRFGGITAILWLSPVILLLAGIGVLIAILRSRGNQQEGGGSGLTEEEQARLQRLIDEAEHDS